MLIDKFYFRTIFIVFRVKQQIFLFPNGRSRIAMRIIRLSTIDTPLVICMRDPRNSRYVGISGHRVRPSPLYVSFVIVNRRDGITPRFVRYRYVHTYTHAVARPSSLCLINSLREVRGCATEGRRVTRDGQPRSGAERVSARRAGVEEVEMFGAHRGTGSVGHFDSMLPGRID